MIVCYDETPFHNTEPLFTALDALPYWADASTHTIVGCGATAHRTTHGLFLENPVLLARTETSLDLHSLSALADVVPHQVIKAYAKMMEDSLQPKSPHLDTIWDVSDITRGFDLRLVVFLRGFCGVLDTIHDTADPDDACARSCLFQPLDGKSAHQHALLHQHNAPVPAMLTRFLLASRWWRDKA